MILRKFLSNLRKITAQYKNNFCVSFVNSRHDAVTAQARKLVGGFTILIKFNQFSKFDLNGTPNIPHSYWVRGSTFSGRNHAFLKAFLWQTSLICLCNAVLRHRLLSKNLWINKVYKYLTSFWSLFSVFILGNIG